MKTVKIDIDKIIEKELGESAIEITAIEGLNVGDIAVLTKDSKSKYFWSKLNSPYCIYCINRTSFYDTINEALFSAISNDKTIYQFKNLKEFAEWLISEISN